MTKDPLRQTYEIATQALRERHREEFIELRKEAAKELGVEWNPRLTAAEKAEQEFDRLLRDYPELALKITEGSA